MNDLQRQTICVMVADLGYDHQPPNGWAPLRHQMLWFYAVKDVPPEDVEAEVADIKEGMLRDGETFVEYCLRPDYDSHG